MTIPSERCLSIDVAQYSDGLFYILYFLNANADKQVSSYHKNLVVFWTISRPWNLLGQNTSLPFIILLFYYYYFILQV